MADRETAVAAYRPIGIDLFCGAGGMSLGFEQAGFDIVAAVDFDPIHAAVHSYNFSRCTTLARSVTDLTGAGIRKAAGLGKKRVDVVFGGAPCQGFSLIGHRALDDPRNSLVREFVRIVSELNPRYFVFENVKGLTVGRQRSFLEEIIEAFGDVGYRVLTPWKVLNAVDYGVPQDRKRLFLIGAKKTQRLPRYPEPTSSGSDSQEPRLGLPMGPTCRDALDDLPDAESISELMESDSAAVDSWHAVSSYARELRCERASSWHFGYRRKGWRKNVLTSSMRTNHTEISRRRFSETNSGTVEPISRLFKLDPEGVSNTLRAGTDASRGAFTSPRPVHYAHHRCLTVREMARLHGFPDWFRLHATKWHGARQVGNAVPPPLARAVASAVVEALRYEPARPRLAVSLGDERLLRLGMSAAAEHWSVPVPIGPRDRKSGAKKRKQEEIERALQRM